jgi:hypothetical protein
LRIGDSDLNTYGNGDSFDQGNTDAEGTSDSTNSPDTVLKISVRNRILANFSTASCAFDQMVFFARR